MYTGRIRSVKWSAHMFEFVRRRDGRALSTGRRRTTHGRAEDRARLDSMCAHALWRTRGGAVSAHRRRRCDGHIWMGKANDKKS